MGGREEEIREILNVLFKNTRWENSEGEEQLRVDYVQNSKFRGVAEKSGDPASSSQKKEAHDDPEKHDELKEETPYFGIRFSKINNKQLTI